MIKKLSYFLACSPLALTAAMPDMPQDLSSYTNNFSEDFVVNNRILLKINNKAISVWDLVKKMDLLFYRQYPDLASSATARYQFYSASWRTILNSVIDELLIVNDAEEKKIVVNDGEVREELESLFGPDVVLNLDKLGMTLQEAFDLLRTELTVQRMSSIMVRSKAFAFVSPSIIKKEYEEFLQKNPPYQCMVYRILSLRGENHEEVAALAHRLLVEEKIPLDDILSHLDSKECTLSEEYIQQPADLSLAYKKILSKLEPGGISAPVAGAKLSRIFYLKEIQDVAPAPFTEIESRLKMELTQVAFERFSNEYREKLRKQYGLTESYLKKIVPGDLKPFEVR